MRAVLILVSFLTFATHAIAGERTVVTFIVDEGFEINLTARFTYHSGNVDPTVVPMAFERAVPTYELQIAGEPLIHCDIYLVRSEEGTIDQISFGEDGYPTEVYKEGRILELSELEAELTDDDGLCAR